MSRADRRGAVLAECGALPSSELTFPFGDEVAVFKVGGKMFALVSLPGETGEATLKCDPDEASALRTEHAGIRAGYHMDKRHWITVDLGADLPAGMLSDLVGNSYDLVVASLPRRLRPAAS